MYILHPLVKLLYSYLDVNRIHVNNVKPLEEPTNEEEGVEEEPEHFVVPMFRKVQSYSQRIF